MNGPFSALCWIGRFGRVSFGAGAYLSFRYLGFRHFGRIERLLPSSGRILDLGCGHGLLAILAAAASGSREVFGIDLLERRLEVGREVARRHGVRNVRFERRDIQDPPAGPFDAIVVADVLFYRPVQAQRELLEVLSARLRPGGRLLIKEQVQEPAWKARLVAMQERLVVGMKVAVGGSSHWSRVAPSGIHLWHEESLEEALRSLGLKPTTERLDRWSWLSHRLFIAAAPAPRAR